MLGLSGQCGRLHRGRHRRPQGIEKIQIVERQRSYQASRKHDEGGDGTAGRGRDDDGHPAFRTRHREQGVLKRNPFVQFGDGGFA